MSRIGNQPIPIPDKVKVAVDGNKVNVEGPLGKISHEMPATITAEIDGANLVVRRPDDARRSKAMHGLTRSLIANHIEGASTGFVKKLEIIGVGFRAAVKGQILNLALGKSHPINYPLPEGIKAVVEDNTKITISGSDKQVVGAVCADIRRYYPPEPYKGKGVRFVGEQIRRKEGKTAQGK